MSSGAIHPIMPLVDDIANERIDRTLIQVIRTLDERQQVAQGLKKAKDIHHESMLDLIGQYNKRLCLLLKIPIPNS